MAKAKPVIPRAQAEQDVDDALTYCLGKGGEPVALGFIAALQHAYRHLARTSANGSPKCAHELNLPSLRCRPLLRCPFWVFYVERDDHVDVWRVLHAQRDVPAWMQRSEDE